MIDINAVELEFNSEASVEAFARWYLDSTTANIRSEFSSETERSAFIRRRERRLLVELDLLHNLKFSSPHRCPINKVSYFRIVPKGTKEPLSAIGSDLMSSRFNYKNSDLLKNRAIYFGQNKRTCFAEKFHLSIQKHNYSKLFERTKEQIKAELPRPEFQILEFEVSVENILVLTTESTFKALGLTPEVAKGEWYYVNDEYEIPTAGQILASVAKKEGFNGILYTSVRDQTKNNLVLFEEKTGELKFKNLSSPDFDPAEMPDD